MSLSANPVTPSDLAGQSGQDSRPDFGLIETFRFEPCAGFLRLDRHLARMQSSALALGFAFNEAAIREALDKIATDDLPLRIRLLLDPNGLASITSSPYQPLPQSTVWRLGIAKTQLQSDDPLLRHKTTHRAIYEQARSEFSPHEIDEVLLLNEKGELCEGTITTLFLDIGKSACITPALECGLLAGILRQELIDQGVAVEARITPDDLANARQIFVGNALRGMIRASVNIPLNTVSEHV